MELVEESFFIQPTLKVDLTNQFRAYPVQFFIVIKLFFHLSLL